MCFQQTCASIQQLHVYFHLLYFTRHNKYDREVEYWCETSTTGKVLRVESKEEIETTTDISMTHHMAGDISCTWDLTDNMEDAQKVSLETAAQPQEKVIQRQQEFPRIEEPEKACNRV